MSEWADRSASFVVRFWCEQRDMEEAPVVWRGSVECVTCGDALYFRQLERLMEFMQAHLKRIGLDAAHLRASGDRAETAPDEPDPDEAPE